MAEGFYLSEWVIGFSVVVFILWLFLERSVDGVGGSIVGFAET